MRAYIFHYLFVITEQRYRKIVKMYFRTRSLILIATILWGTQCTNPQKKAEASEESLRSSLMQVHDEVMPLMGQLIGLTAQLREILRQDTLLDTGIRLQMESAVKEMEMAEEGMMDWMAAFRQPESMRPTTQHEAIMKYLEAEKKKIEGVNSQIKTGIEKGEQLIKNYRR